MDLYSFYNQKISEFSEAHAKTEKLHKQLMFYRLLVFVATVASVYFLTRGLHFVIPFVFLAGFIVLVLWDLRVVKKSKRLQGLININRHELKCLDHHLNNEFDDGTSYINSKHPYSFDIDILGGGTLFHHNNRTVTLKGNKTLSDYLLKNEINAAMITERREAVQELEKNPDFIQEFMLEHYLHNKAGKDKENDDLTFKHLPDVPVEGLWLKLCMVLIPIGFFVSLVLALTQILPFNFATIMFLFELAIVGFYMKKINTYHSKVGAFCKKIQRNLRLLRTFRDVQLSSDKMHSLHSSLISSKESALNEFGRIEKLLNAFDNRLNMFVGLILNGTIMYDFWLILWFNKWLRHNKDKLPVWKEQLAELDALVSLANYNFNHPEFVLPEISDNIYFEASDLGHPLIPKKARVSNDFKIAELHDLSIVTGANMAGKSTFLRTVLVNLILASAGSKVCASSFNYKPTRIFSSIRTFDNLVDDVSYFQAELIRLKEMIDLAKEGQPVIIAIDEPLKGTNSEDKRKGSIQLLKKLIDLPVFGLVATHDLELQVLAKEDKRFRLLCFELDFEEDKVIYSYKLQNGVATRLNANILMKSMGIIS